MILCMYVCSYSTTVQIYCSVGLYTVQCRSTVLYCILLFVVIFICLNKCAGGIPCLWHHLVGRKKFIIVFYMGIKKSWLYALSRDGGSHSFIIFVPEINLATSTRYYIVRNNKLYKVNLCIAHRCYNVGWNIIGLKWIISSILIIMNNEKRSWFFGKQIILYIFSKK